MIDKDTFVRRAELELRNSRTLSLGTCQVWENLPDEARTAFARAVAFLGCLLSGTVGTPSPPSSEADRVAAARLMLLKLGLDSDDPKWSSDLLDRLLKAVMEGVDGSIGDLIRALFGVLGDYSPELSKPVAGFIKELVVKCFTRYALSYDAVDWRQFVQSLSGVNLTKAQMYLALYAIPPQFTSPQLTDAIAKGLESTAFREEAASALAV